jgi:hypothetical protein
MLELTLGGVFQLAMIPSTKAPHPSISLKELIVGYFEVGYFEVFESKTDVTAGTKKPCVCWYRLI